MAKYRVTCDIMEVTGSQSYLVDADSPEAAIDAVRGGMGSFEDEDICVGSLLYPDVSEVEQVED